jgi:hypothetical protein
MGEEAVGLVEQLHKNVVIGDMTYILKTVFENVKYWPFKDITELTLANTTNKGLRIFKIVIDNVTLNTEPKNYNVVADNQTFEVNLTSNVLILTYLISFKWEATSAGVHVAFGGGTAQYENNMLLASYNPVHLESKLNVSGIITLKSLTGKGLINLGIETWVKSKLSSELCQDIKKGINYNKDFLHEYMHLQHKQIKKSLNNNFVLDYNGQIFKVIESKDHIMYLYKVWLELNEEFISNISLGIPIPAENSHHVSFHIAPQYIPLTIDAHGLAKKCDEYVDLKILNLTGTVKDLFIALPELYRKYNGGEFLKLYCEYAHEGINGSLPHNRIELPANCKFIVKNKVELSTELTFSMVYEPVANGTNFKTKMKEVSVVKCISKPQSLTAVMFLIDLFNKHGSMKFASGDLNVPMIFYIPRNYTERVSVKGSVQDGIFVNEFDYPNLS